MAPDRNTGIVPVAAERAAADDDSALTPDVDPAEQAEPVDSAGVVPDLGRTARAIRRERTRSIEATLLTVLAMLYTLYFARAFLIPIVFALLLNFLLSPLIRLLARAGIKAPLGAA